MILHKRHAARLVWRQWQIAGAVARTIAVDAAGLCRPVEAGVARWPAAPGGSWSVARSGQILQQIIGASAMLAPVAVKVRRWLRLPWNAAHHGPPGDRHVPRRCCRSQRARAVRVCAAVIAVAIALKLAVDAPSYRHCTIACATA